MDEPRGLTLTWMQGICSRGPGTDDTISSIVPYLPLHQDQIWQSADSALSPRPEMKSLLVMILRCFANLREQNGGITCIIGVALLAGWGGVSWGMLARHTLLLRLDIFSRRRHHQLKLLLEWEHIWQLLL